MHGIEGIQQNLADVMSTTDKAIPVGRGLSREKIESKKDTPGSLLSSDESGSNRTDRSLRDRNIDVVEPRKEEGVAVAPKRNIKQKLAHLLSELKARVRGENFKPVSSELMAKISNPKLKSELENRNGKIDELATLKARKDELETGLKAFDHRYGKSLALLYQSGGIAPEKGRYPGGDGKVFDFSEPYTFADRQDLLQQFKDSFKSSPELDTYNKERLELHELRGSRQAPGLVEQKKQELKAVSQQLVGKLDTLETNEKVLRAEQYDSDIESSRKKSVAQYEDKLVKYRTNLATLNAEVYRKKEALHTLKQKLRDIRLFQLPKLELQLKEARERTRTDLSMLKLDSSKTPSEIDAQKETVLKNFRGIRRKIVVLQASCERKQTDLVKERTALRKEFFDQINQRNTAKKELKTELKRLEETIELERKGKKKTYQSAQKTADRESKALRKSLR